MISWDLKEAIRNHGIGLVCLRGLETKRGDVRLYQIRKKEMREQRQLPRLRLFFFEDETDDFAQARINLFVIVLEPLFQLRNRGRYRLEENWSCCF